jgi:DNA helicase IV
MAEPTATATHPDLPAEQAYLDQAYECLEAMRKDAAKLIQVEVAADPYAQEVVHEMFLARLADLSEETSLCFGRIDRVDGDLYYIGRRHVHDANLDPVVIDWRAPVAEAFYQASWEDAWELERRRSFLTEGRSLLDIQDEAFGERHARRSVESAGPLVRSGDALLYELARERTGRMRDVAATIQAEQDRLIRASADGILVVQGAPGTGKTAVGLHRAAYLLFSMRDSLQRTGVLIVGPNRAFMAYVERVLPDLGETTVVQKAIDELAAVRVDAEDRDDVLRLKGDGRMAEVLRRALIARTRPPAQAVRLQVGLRTVAVEPSDLGRLLAAAHTSPAPYRERRDRFAILLADHVYVTAYGSGTFGAEASELMAALSRDPGFRGLLDRVWPSTTAADLVRGVLGDPALLARAADGLLSSEERELLAQGGGRRDRWSVGDAALIDEAQALLVGTSRTYGHVIVDEAQDLSPMQLRMIARRAPSGSITILGDVAQATGLWPHTSWDEVLAQLPGGAAARVEALGIGYRVPKEILDLAGRLLPRIAPDLTPPVAIREGSPPEFLRVSEGALFRALMNEMQGAMSERGTLGVILPEAMLGEALVQARANRIEVDAADWGRGRKITLLAPRQAKGLEFDHVVLAEPADIAADPRDGYRQLYVALTRSTQTLKIVHTKDLPLELRPDHAYA